MGDRDSDNGFLLGLIIGGVIGAGAVFLFGTEKGKEVREELKEKGDDALDDLDDVLTQLEKKGKEIKKKADIVKEEIAEKAGEMKENVSEEVVEKLDDTLAHIEALQERGREATASLRKKYFIKDGKKLG